MCTECLIRNYVFRVQKHSLPKKEYGLLNFYSAVNSYGRALCKCQVQIWYIIPCYLYNFSCFFSFQVCCPWAYTRNLSRGRSECLPQLPLVTSQRTWVPCFRVGAPRNVTCRCFGPLAASSTALCATWPWIRNSRWRCTWRRRNINSVTPYINSQQRLGTWGVMMAQDSRSVIGVIYREYI